MLDGRIERGLAHGSRTCIGVPNDVAAIATALPGAAAHAVLRHWIEALCPLIDAIAP